MTLHDNTLQFNNEDEASFWKAAYLAALPHEGGAEGSSAWSRADEALDAYRRRSLDEDEASFWKAAYLAALPHEGAAEGSSAWSRADDAWDAYRRRSTK